MKSLFIVLIVILLGFGLTACNNNTLGSYKTAGKTAIETHAATKVQDNYCTENWAVLCDTVTAGKIAVDDAENKAGVDMVVTMTKDKIDKVENKLKQGYYITDDKVASIRLYGDNLFNFSIIYMSFLPKGRYSIDNGKLILNYSDTQELVFEIGNGQLLFIGANIEGSFVEDGPLKVGTIFKISFIEVAANEMVDCSQFAYSITMSWIGNPIVLKHSDENAVFECVVNNGSFSHHDETKNIIIKAGEGFHWRSNEEVKDEQTFIEIVLKIEDSIIGYSVVEIYKNNESNFYRAKLLKAALLPKVDNQYQQVSQEQIQFAIELAKKA